MMLPLLHADIFGGRRSTRLLAMPFFQKNKTQKLIATTPPQINNNKTKSILIITKIELCGLILLDRHPPQLYNILAMNFSARPLIIKVKADSSNSSAVKD